MYIVNKYYLVMDYSTPNGRYEKKIEFSEQEIDGIKLAFGTGNSVGKKLEELTND